MADGHPRRRRRRPFAVTGRPARPGHGLLGGHGPSHARHRGPLLAGLRAAAGLATDIGGAAATSDGRRWAAAATRLARAITATFGRPGTSTRPPPNRAPTRPSPFSGRRSPCRALRCCRPPGSAQRTLTLPDGGLRPGTRLPAPPAWPGPRRPHSSRCSTPRRAARPGPALLGWLAAHRTRLGSLPEKVSSACQPAAVAPLPWTDAVTLLALLAQARHLPAIPVPPPGPATLPQSMLTPAFFWLRSPSRTTWTSTAAARPGFCPVSPFTKDTLCSGQPLPGA